MKSRAVFCFVKTHFLMLNLKVNFFLSVCIPFFLHTLDFLHLRCFQLLGVDVMWRVLFLDVFGCVITYYYYACILIWETENFWLHYIDRVCVAVDVDVGENWCSSVWFAVGKSWTFKSWSQTRILTNRMNILFFFFSYFLLLVTLFLGHKRERGWWLKLILLLCCWHVMPAEQKS